MKKHSTNFILLLFCLCRIVIVNAQSSDPCNERGKHFYIKTVFAGIPGGEINIHEHLDDSLYFSDDCANKTVQIVSFHLALKCNGNVLKYFENKNGNHLTDEMKEAVVELLPGCTLTFDGIKSRTLKKDTRKNNYDEFDFGMLKFTLVQ